MHNIFLIVLYVSILKIDFQLRLQLKNKFTIKIQEYKYSRNKNLTYFILITFEEKHEQFEEPVRI